MYLNALLADCLVAERRAALQAAAVTHPPARRGGVRGRRARKALLEIVTNGITMPVGVDPS
jgi:hypothetical protein